MATHIPQAFLQELLAATDVVDVIGAHLQLRRAGAEYKALCPFHEEKTPSFQVSPRKQFFYCFGCHASGDAIGFLTRYRNLDFPTAVEELAHRAGLQVPRTASARDPGADAAARQENQMLYTLLERAASYYSAQLQRQPRAQEYLARRGLNPDTLKQFQVGFAPPGTSLVPKLRRDGVGMEALRRSGLSSEDGHRDRFHNRIIFPIRDPRGRVVGLGGRVLESGEAQRRPKYLNSPETPIFHKRRELYGFYQAPGTPRPERYYLVEGYLDVLTLEQHGVSGAVSALGTAVTQTHLARLLRARPRLTICLDGDTAGRQAARQVLERSLPLLEGGRELHFCFLPEGEDPDSFVRKHGATAFTSKELCQPLSIFFLKLFLEGADLNSTEGRGAVLARAREPLRQIPDPILRKGFIRELARAAHSPPEELEALVSGGQGSRAPRMADATSATPPRARGNPPGPLSRIISLLLLYPEFAADFTPDSTGARLLAELREPGLDFLLQLLEFLRQHPDSNCAGILHHWRDSPYAKRLRELAARTEPLEDKAAVRLEFQQAIVPLWRKLARQSVRKAGDAIRELLRKAPEARSDLEQQSLRALQENQHRLKKWAAHTEAAAQDPEELQSLREETRRCLGEYAAHTAAPPRNTGEQQGPPTPGRDTPSPAGDNSRP